MTNLHIIDTPDKAVGLLTTLIESKLLCGIDTETEGIDPRTEAPAQSNGRIVCWSLAWKDKDGYQRAYLTAECLEVFKPWLEDPQYEKVGHNVFSFDYHMFYNHGIQVAGLVGDTMHMSKLAWNHPDAKHGLKQLAKVKLGVTQPSYKSLFSRQKAKPVEVPKEKRTWRKINGERVPTYIAAGTHWQIYKTTEELSLSEVISNPIWAEKKKQLHEYASLDAELTLRLYYKFKSQLTSIAWIKGKSLFDFYKEVWNPNLYVLVEAEQQGFALDIAACREAVFELTKEATLLQQDIDNWVGREINWKSPKQVAEYLYDELRLPTPPIQGTLKAIKRTKRGDRPTSEASLTWLAENTCATTLSKVLTYKKDLKDIQIISSFPSQVDGLGRLHYQLSPSTDTGRLSIKNPSVNCIKKGGLARKAFIAGEGFKLIGADYSSLEPRLLAHFHAKLFKDTALADDIASGDLYLALVDRYSQLGYDITRDIAKVLVLSINYGKSAKGLAAQLGISVEEAEYLLELFYEAYPVMVRWQMYCESFALNNGYVKTLMGRIRYIPEISEQYYRGSGYRKAINTPIQGSAADLVTMAMLKCYTGRHNIGYSNPTLYRTGCRLICQVHDELIFRVPASTAEESLEEVVRVMEQPLTTPLLVPTPVEAKIGDNWLETK